MPVRTLLSITRRAWQFTLQQRPRGRRFLASKVKAKPEAKPEAKMEAKPQAIPEAIAEAMPDAKEKSKVEAKEKAKVKAKVEAKVEAKARSTARSKAKTKAKTKAKAKAEAKAKAKAEAKAEAKVKAKEKAKAKAKAKAKVKAKAITKADAKAEAKPEANPEAKAKAMPEAKPEAMPEAKPEAMPEAIPEAKPEAILEANLEAKLKAKLKAKEKAREKAKEKAKEIIKEKAKEKIKVEAKVKAKVEAKAIAMAKVPAQEEGKLGAMRVQILDSSAAAEYATKICNLGPSEKDLVFWSDASSVNGGDGTYGWSVVYKTLKPSEGSEWERITGIVEDAKVNSAEFWALMRAQEEAEKLAASLSGLGKPSRTKKRLAINSVKFFCDSQISILWARAITDRDEAAVTSFRTRATFRGMAGHFESFLVTNNRLRQLVPVVEAHWTPRGQTLGNQEANRAARAARDVARTRLGVPPLTPLYPQPPTMPLLDQQMRQVLRLAGGIVVGSAMLWAKFC